MSISALFAYLGQQAIQSQAANKTQETEKAEEAKKAQQQQQASNTINNNNPFERNPQEDVFSFGAERKELAKQFIKSLPALYVASFCIGFYPELFVAATGAFLFANKGQSFMEKIANTIADNQKAFDQLNKAQAEKEAKAPQNTEAKAPNAPQNETANPVAEVEPEKEMTPAELAQAKIAHSHSLMEKREALLRRDEASLRERQAKLETCQQQIDNCQDTDSQKYQDLCARREKLQNGVLAMEQRVIERQARYDKSVIDYSMAQKQLENINAEEMVAV